MSYYEVQGEKIGWTIDDLKCFIRNGPVAAGNTFGPGVVAAMCASSIPEFVSLLYQYQIEYAGYVTPTLEPEYYI
mgnify:CR=1 FL=1